MYLIIGHFSLCLYNVSLFQFSWLLLYEINIHSFVTFMIIRSFISFQVLNSIWDRQQN